MSPSKLAACRTWSSRRRRLVISFVAAAILATAVPTLAVPHTAGAQANSGNWDVFDDPELQGPMEYWFPGQAGRGYGSNNYRYTYAAGGAANAVNTAVWDLGNRMGTQELQAFVPCQHSVATVRYEVSGPGFTREVAVNQANECGHAAWTSLGRFAFNGGSATVILRDNNSDQHHRRGALWRSGFGVDAIRARCVVDCETGPQISGTPAAPRNLQAEFTNCPEYERGCLSFTFAPPSLDDGSSFTGYEYVMSRAGGRWEGTQQSTSYRFGNAFWETTYTYEVRALNGRVKGPAARISITTPADPSHTTSARVATADPSDYPYGEGCHGRDDWNFYDGQCTSYVAWRLNDAGISFHNINYKNGGRTPLPVIRGYRRWGHAKTWAYAARTVGIAVDSTPAPGAVAQWTYGWTPGDKSRCPDPAYHGDPNGCFGHVAYVEWVSADGNQVRITEMNFGTRCGHGERTLTRGKAGWPANFIHFELANP